MPKVLLVIAFSGYQPTEYGEPKRVLSQAGYEVITTSTQIGEAQAAYDGSTTIVNTKIIDINPEDYVGLFFIGGPGALEDLDNEESYKLLRTWQTTGKPYGAICISPRILAKAGVLKNKQATGWDNDNELANIFAINNVEYVKEKVVTDGNVITASGPEVAEEFGQAILKVIL
ncbi:MAG: DJ-1/PfpI family protein [Candidatus Magasanikiibacteriota bacterium]